MKWRENVAGRLWRFRYWFLVIGGVAGLIAGVVMGYCVGIGWGVFSGLSVFFVPNIYNVSEFIKGVRVVKIAWREAEISQQERQKRIQILLQLEQSQRNHIGSLFESNIVLVDYRGLTATAPHLTLKVRVFNLSVFGCKITGWKLRLERPDDEQMTCMGERCQLRPQEGKDYKAKIDACYFTNIDIRIDVEPVIVKLIKQSSCDKQLIYFHMYIDWQIELEEIGTHTYQGSLVYHELPNC